MKVEWMKAIKEIYNFVLSIQIVCLIIFIFYLFDSGFELIIPIKIKFSDSFSYEESFRFNEQTIILFIGGLATALVVSSINVVQTGLTDEGNITIKQFVAFITKFLLLLTPVLYIIGKSELLNSFSAYISLFLLVIHLFNFIENIGGENA